MVQIILTSIPPPHPPSTSADKLGCCLWHAAYHLAVASGCTVTRVNLHCGYHMQQFVSVHVMGLPCNSIGSTGFYHNGHLLCPNCCRRDKNAVCAWSWLPLVTVVRTKGVNISCKRERERRRKEVSNMKTDICYAQTVADEIKTLYVHDHDYL